MQFLNIIQFHIYIYYQYDLIGIYIFNHEYKIISNLKKGLYISNIILADEINRAHLNVQSALLESMAEKHNHSC